MDGGIKREGGGMEWEGGGVLGGGWGILGILLSLLGGGGEGDWFSYLETGLSTIASATYDAANVTYDAALKTGLFWLLLL